MHDRYLEQFFTFNIPLYFTLCIQFEKIENINSKLKYKHASDIMD